jgi:hypothetical protein
LGFELEAALVVAEFGAANTGCIPAQELQGARHIQADVGDAVDFPKSPLANQGFEAISA